MTGVPIRPASDAATTDTRTTAIEFSSSRLKDPHSRPHDEATSLLQAGCGTENESSLSARTAPGFRPVTTGSSMSASGFTSFARSVEAMTILAYDRSLRSGCMLPENRLRRALVMSAIAASTAGCVPTSHETLAASCSDYIGKPISARIAALGPPKSVYRIDANQVGYVFESRQTTFVGGESYYTVNYMTGADKHRTPIRPVTTVCSGIFVVRAPSDRTPLAERIVVDVRRDL
jgi:hypothetical protein